MNTVSWQTPLSSEELSPLLQSDTLPLAEPWPSSWGYYLDIGQGMGYFSWFPDRDHMLRHLGHVEVLHLPSLMPERADYEALVDKLLPLLHNYVENVQAGDDTAGEQLVAAYEKTVPELKLRWVGSLTQLQAEASPFAVALREAFESSEGQTAAEAQSEDWLSFLADYGI